MHNLPVEKLIPYLSEGALGKLAGTYIDVEAYDRFVEPNIIYVDAETGAPQILWLTTGLSLELQALALPVFQHNAIAAPGTAAYRPLAAGPAPGDAGSGIIGYFDRTRQHPYCRQTAFNLNHPKLFERALPYIQRVDMQFQRHFPAQWWHQMYAAMFTRGYIMRGTSFSTMTINKNFRTAVHKDQGDLLGSFGVMTVFKTPGFTGGHLIVPKYRVSIPYGNGDICFLNVHEWHGNSEIHGEPGTYERLSVVFYQRQRIVQCGTLNEELARVRGRSVGDPLYGWVRTGVTGINPANTIGPYFVAESHKGSLGFEAYEESDEWDGDDGSGERSHE
jgi:hypothetical protein